MARSITLALAAAMACAGAAQAQETSPPTPREALTWMILNEINGAYFDRAEPMNRPAIVTQVPEGMLRAVDISHDGVDDWLIDYTDSGMSWCGTGGCLRTLYVSVTDGLYVQAWNEQSFDFQIEERGGETVIETPVHHTYCVPDDFDCAYAWAWDAEAGGLVERPNRAGQTVLRGGIAPVAIDEPHREPDGLPPVLGQVWRTEGRSCPSTWQPGMLDQRRPVIRSTPDLNGDGRRDWLVEPPYACEDRAGDPVDQPPFRIYLSRAEGDPVQAYESETDRYAAFDIASRPAMLIANPSCGYGTACPDLRLRWDAGAGSFIPAPAR